MKKKLFRAAVKAAPLVLGATPTTRDLRAAALERAARWATDRVRDRLDRDDHVDEVEDEDGHGETPDEAAAARERIRARMGSGGEAERSGAAGKAAKGLAAAVLALPLGMWVGSRLRSRG